MLPGRKPGFRAGFRPDSSPVVVEILALLLVVDLSFWFVAEALLNVAAA